MKEKEPVTTSQTKVNKFLITAIMANTKASLSKSSRYITGGLISF